MTSSICLVIDRLSNRSGGAEKVVITVANEFARAGLRVTILTWEAHDELPFYALDRRVRLINLMPIKERRRLRTKGTGRVRVRERTRRLFKRMEGVGGLAKIIWQREHGSRIAQLREFFLAEKPDVAIGFLPSSFPYMVKAAAGLDIKVVSSCHNVPERDFEDPERWSQNAYDIAWRTEALRQSDATTTLLDKFVPFFEREKVKNVHVIPNFVDIAPAEELSFERNSKTIIVVGRLAAQKDHKTLLQAWHLLKGDYPDWAVHIYGTGPLRTQLYELHRKLALNKSLIFKGESRDIEDAYRDAEIFCIPSIHEGFGLVTAEAMANGLPVVGFADCDGTNDIVVDGVTGILAPGDGDRAKNLAASLKTMMDDADRRREMAVAGHSSVQRFGRETAMEKWFEMLRQLGVERPAPEPASEPAFDVTVAIPVYNGADEIGRSLESLVAQDFEGTFEVLICDDGSTDDTIAVVDRWRDQLPNIRLLKNETNRGRPYSRQRLLQEARGTYITWLDADDTKAEEFISEHVNRLRNLEADNPDRVCATYCYYTVHYPDDSKKDRQHRREVSGSFLVQLLTAKFEAYLWVFMMRTSDARMCQFDVELLRLQDLDFFMKFSLYRPVLVRTETKRSLCTYYKIDSGRSVDHVENAWFAIRDKHRYLFRVLGRGFTFNYTTHALNVTARYARINGLKWRALGLRSRAKARRTGIRTYVALREALGI